MGEQGTERVERVELPLGELRTGDVVLNYGMRIRLGERGERVDEGAGAREYGPRVIWFAGVVENIADLLDEDGRLGYLLRGLLDPARPTWSVQSREGVSWIVERAAVSA